MSITLTPSDGMLKTPLMPQSVQNFSGTNGAIEHEPMDPDTPGEKFFLITFTNHNYLKCIFICLFY